MTFLQNPHHCSAILKSYSVWEKQERWQQRPNNLKTNPGTAAVGPTLVTRWLLFGLSQVALAAQRHQQGKHLMAGKSPALASPWPSDCPTRLAGCVSLFLWTPKKKLSSELAVFLRLIPSFHHQDSVKSEILWSAQDETEGKKPAQDVFPRQVAWGAWPCRSHMLEVWCPK